MKVRRTPLVISSFAALLTLPFIVLQPKIVAQDGAPPSLWIQNRLKSEIITQEPYDNAGDYGPDPDVASCEPHTFVIKRPLSLGVPNPNDMLDATCADKLAHESYIGEGRYGVLYFQSGRNELAGKIDYLDKYFKTIPGEDIVLERQSVGGKFQVRLIENFSSKLSPRYRPLSGLLNYSIDREDSQLIYDSQGRLIEWAGTNGGFNVWAYPSSILLDYKNGSLVKIDRETKQAVMFGKGSIRKTGTGPKPPAAIFDLSLDGRYAVVVGSDRTKTYLYDLENCVESTSPVAEAHRAQKSLECDYVDIGQHLSTEFNSGFSIKVNNAEFDNWHQIVVGFNYDDGSGKKYVKARIAPEELPFSDRGGFIAMGDSFISGEGDPDHYALGTDEPENKCHLSIRSYPYQIASFLSLDDFHSVACSGAVTDHVRSAIQEDEDGPSNNSLGKWLPGIKPQKNYLEDSSPGVLIISVGGNDIDFAGKLAECVAPGTCKYAEEGVDRGNVAAEIALLRSRLVNVYKDLIKRTKGKTMIFVVGYPQFVSGEADARCGLNVGLNSDERRFVHEGVKYMNQVIRSATEEAGVHYLDIENSLDEAKLCSGAPDHQMAVNGLTRGNDKAAPWWARIISAGPITAMIPNVGIGNESFHPNYNGHVLIGSRILGLTEGDPLSFAVCSDYETAVCPVEDTQIPYPDSSYWGDAVVEFVDNLNAPQRVIVDPIPQNRSLVVGEPGRTRRQVTVRSDGLLAGSTVRVEIHSEPIEVGEFTVGADGSLDISFSVPEGILPGFHTLHVFGASETGEPVDYYESVVVLGGEKDLDGDGIEDANDPCGFVEASGVDFDQDGVDDTCDGYIGEAPAEEDIEEVGEADNNDSNQSQENTTGLTQEDADDDTRTSGSSELSLALGDEPRNISTAAVLGKDIALLSAESDMGGSATQSMQKASSLPVVGGCILGLFLLGFVFLKRTRP